MKKDATPSRTNDDEPPVRCNGADGDFIYFSTPSSSGAVNEDGSPKWYDVNVGKRDGIITCTCPDAEYRAKFGLVNDPTRGHTCIHIRRCMAMLEKILEEPDEVQ